MRNLVECKAKGCENYALKKGYCDLHYYGFRLYGDPLKRKNMKNTGKCLFCRKYAASKGMCATHYHQQWRAIRFSQPSNAAK